MKFKSLLVRAVAGLALMLILGFGIAACGGSSRSGGTKEVGGPAIVFNQKNANVSIAIGSKVLPENEILGEIYAQALSAAGYKVKRDLLPTSETLARQAVKSDEVAGYPEYVSTVLTSLFGLELEEVPSDARSAYEEAKAEFNKEGLTAFPPTPFEAVDAVGMLKEKAEEDDLEKVSDLEGVSEELTVSGSPECRQRIDCLAGLEKYYGLKFKAYHPIYVDARYRVLESGQADLAVLYTTDPQLATERNKFVILKDDKHVFPAGNVLFVTKPSVVKEAGPDYEKTIIAVQKGLTIPMMQRLNAQVELEYQTPKEAAAAYLKSAGYTY